MKLQNKRFLVTGATGGIGSVVCKLLAEKGARLLMTSTQLVALDLLRKQLPGSHEFAVANLDTATGRQDVVDACAEQGGIDGLINLAGVLDFALFEQQSPDMIEKIIATNLLAPMLLCHAVLPALRTRETAVLLNVGSIFGSIGHPGFVSYCTSKAGMKCFTEALARELADTPVRVAYIAPRATATTMNGARVDALNAALGNKADTPEFVAGEIVAFLKGNERIRYLGWPEKLFVRINAVLPGLVHNSLVRNLPVIKKFATAGEM